MLYATEINILVEALDAWENKDSASGFMGSLLGMMASDKADAEQQQKMEQALAEKEEKRKEEKVIRVEQSTLLKAKLIQMRNAIEAQAAAEIPVCNEPESN